MSVDLQIHYSHRTHTVFHYCGEDLNYALVHALGYLAFYNGRHYTHSGTSSSMHMPYNKKYM